MGLTDLLDVLRRLAGTAPAPIPDLIVPGARLSLRNPLATPHKVWIPAGATGIVVGWDRQQRRVNLELDSPRTLVSVPWSWVEAVQPPPAPKPPTP